MVGLHNSALRHITLIILAYHSYFQPIHFTNGLKINQLHVPEAVQKGRDYELGCDYQLNHSEKLYALRWYKDFLEFYRYMPEENPSRRSFNSSGLKINMTLSTSNRVVLTSVDTVSSGNYRCEVSVEAPSFETDVLEATLRVIEQPIGNPFITASRGVIGPTVNQPIIANCSGPEGYPAPDLFWTLGSELIPADDKLVTHVVQNGINGENLKKTVSFLHLPVDWIATFANNLEKSRNLTPNNPLSDVVPLNCTSHIRGLFKQSDTIDIRIVAKPMLTTPYPVVILSNRDVVRTSKSSLTAPDANNTHHGAFKNASPSFFTSLPDGWMTGVCCSLLSFFTGTRTRYSTTF